MRHFIVILICLLTFSCSPEEQNSYEFDDLSTNTVELVDFITKECLKSEITVLLKNNEYVRFCDGRKTEVDYPAMIIGNTNVKMGDFGSFEVLDNSDLVERIKMIEVGSKLAGHEPVWGILFFETDLTKSRLGEVLRTFSENGVHNLLVVTTLHEEK